MLSVKKALEIILDAARPLSPAVLPIKQALGRVIAEDVTSEVTIPPYDNSAMDGYAVRSEDLKTASEDSPCRLHVLGTIAAGDMPQKSVSSGAAIQIMTGAAVPEGADSVIPVEKTRRDGDSVEVFSATKAGQHIRRAGEDIQPGQLCVSKDRVLGPMDIGVLASIGRPEAPVVPSAKVAILSTGDELLLAHEPAEEGKIRTSNNYTLSGMAVECGATPIDLGVVKDRPGALPERLKEAADADVFVTSGGVSMGEFDYVKKDLDEMGWEFKFWKVAIKPGKPMIFGLWNGKPFFGLPGNPASSVVTFEVFVRPALMKMMGHTTWDRPEVEAELTTPIRTLPNRAYYTSAILTQRETQYYVASAGSQSSGVLSSLVRANCLIVTPEGTNSLEPGARVRVQLLGPSLPA